MEPYDVQPATGRSVPPPLPPVACVPPPPPLIAARPAPQTALPLPKPPPSRHRKWWIVAGTLTALAIGGAVTVITRHEIGKASIPPTEAAGDRSADTAAAFTGTPTNAPASAADQQAIVSLVQTHATAVAQRNAAKVVDCYNLERTMREVERDGQSLGMSTRGRQQFISGLRIGYSSSVSNGDFPVWKRHQVRRIRMLESGVPEALVYIRAWHPDGTGIKARWWVRKEAGAWKIYDTEDLDAGFRRSTFIRLSATDSNSGQWASVATEIRKANDAVIAGDAPTAEAALGRMEQYSMPQLYDALRHMHRGNLHIIKEEYEEALTEAATAESLHPDLATTRLVRANALNRLGRYEDTLATIAAYERLIGPDEVSTAFKGEALRGLGRREEALAAFRSGLAEDPGSVDNLCGLASLLPPGDKSELTAGFRVTANPKNAFASLAAQAVDRRDIETLNAILPLYRPSPTVDHLPEYYAGEVLILEQKWQEALDHFNRLRPNCPRSFLPTIDGERAAALRITGKYIESYQTAPDPDQAFRAIERLLETRKNPAVMRELVAIHRRGHPTDPFTWQFEGLAAELEKDFEKASATYLQGVKRVEEKDRLFLQRLSALAWFSAGKPLEGYRRSPTPEVFGVLANRCYFSDKTEDLTAIIAARRKDSPGDASLLLWDARCSYLRKDYADVVQRLTRDRVAILADGPEAMFFYRPVLIRSLVRLKRFDEAMAEAKKPAGKEADDWSIAIVQTAAGDVPAATATMARIIGDEPEMVEDLYDDEDIGPALMKPAFKPWRDKHPRPATRPVD